ncbi:LmbE family N-acetylglucosaminyl deacetylase [Sphaerotilus hippei]|uniref:LmbE family N-acetylglucosaminyl deacetylase n=1 Tax=Sphaerotilus hippei TaxID=744406 RepID=A0A318H4R3_9BURK|nr:PIG-L family deacetylase [Sphaerotilus hippei]PXW96196.1 LmbE family N-acetylglucosaminyl deacetylase [Sphaerotilus hippei]
MPVVEGLRRLLRRWVRPDARNSLAVALLLAGHDRWPRRVDQWQEARVLVLSPHPDDEAIGCAGAVLQHVAQGAAVHVVQLSDGALGDRRLHDPALDAPGREALQRRLRDTRRQEALAWGRAAGVTQVRFLEAPDGGIGPHEPQVRRLALWLDELQPRLIYLPFVTDLLEDHWQTSRLLAAALARCGAWQRSLVLRCYEVWAPLPANRVVELDDPLAERKQALLSIYASQLRDVDYRRAIAGLNTYRSMLLPDTGAGQAEAYVEASLPGWLDLIRRAAQPPHAPDTDRPR